MNKKIMFYSRKKIERLQEVTFEIKYLNIYVQKSISISYF